MSKNLTTKTTIENLAAELKKRFAATDARLAAAEEQTARSFKSAKTDGNAVKFYTSGDVSGDPAFTLDLHVDRFLDQAKTAFVQTFAWSVETYPGSENPNLDGKPVMVLAVKGATEEIVSYSFLDMTALAAQTVEGTAGNLLMLSEDGKLVDSGKSAADFVAAEADNDVVRQNDIADYTAEEIAALLGAAETEEV